MRVFLSYRRSDVGGHAGRLADALVARLGPQNVFQDVTDIAAGRDFAIVIQEALDRCDAALAVIGPGWLTAATPEGRPRLFQPDDYVRLELATVLQRDLPVAPVLVGGARLPDAEALPEDLRPLLRRQAIALRDETWHQDVDSLLRSLRGEAAKPRRRARRLAVIAVVAAVLVVGAGLLAWRPWAGGSGGSSSAAEPPPCPDPAGEGWTSLPLAPDPRAEAHAANGRLTYSVREARWRALAGGQWELVLDTSLRNDTSDFVHHGYWEYASVVVGGREFEESCFDTPRQVVRPGTVGDARAGFVLSCEPGGRILLVLNADRQFPVTDAAGSSTC